MTKKKCPSHCFRITFSFNVKKWLKKLITSRETNLVPVGVSNVFVFISGRSVRCYFPVHRYFSFCRTIFHRNPAVWRCRSLAHWSLSRIISWHFQWVRRCDFGWSSRNWTWQYAMNFVAFHLAQHRHWCFRCLRLSQLARSKTFAFEAEDFVVVNWQQFSLTNLLFVPWLSTPLKSPACCSSVSRSWSIPLPFLVFSSSFVSSRNRDSCCKSKWRLSCLPRLL